MCKIIVKVSKSLGLYEYIYIYICMFNYKYSNINKYMYTCVRICIHACVYIVHCTVM